MSDFAEKADRLLNQEHIKVAYAARAMDRIEAAGKRGFRAGCIWQICRDDLLLQMFSGFGGRTIFKRVPWSAIRNDEQDPLEAAEQAAMEELKG